MATTRLGPVSRFRSGHRTGQLRAEPGRRSLAGIAVVTLQPAIRRLTVGGHADGHL
jgi:hypothetical protein